MTEQEVKELIKYINEEYFYYDKKGEFDEINEALDMAISALEEIQQYRTLGTPEELREAREKQISKKPIKRSFIIPYEGIDVCPSCKEPISKKEHHCKCGQAIDWSDK